MSDDEPNPGQAALERLIGEWTLEIDFPGLDRIDAGTHVTFEWLPGRRFVLERWQIPAAEFPDGMAVIGWDPARESLLQHYFDSRGVARVYVMGIEGDVWTLGRSEPDFSPLEFEQRFIGEFKDDGATIAGRWEAKQPGRDWDVDFHVTYRRSALTGDVDRGLDALTPRA